MAVAIRYDDGRRSKYRGHNPQSIESLSQQILDDINRRPKQKFQVGEIVHTPDGYKEVASVFYGSKEWQYRDNRRYPRIYPEKELSPILYRKNDMVTLPSKAEAMISNITLAKSGALIFVCKIAEKQFSVYTYEELLQSSPPSADAILSMVWTTFIERQGNETYFKEIATQILTTLRAAGN